jgi:pimeloyl-ACP methyl ester carboxylesterase
MNGITRSGASKTTFVLIPGAGGDAAYWDELIPELQRRGHDAVAVDIEQDDPRLGLPEYNAITTAAIDDVAGGDVVLVAQSLAGFIAPVAGRHRAVSMIVLLNAMVPLPGETPGAWWDATGAPAARLAADEAAGRDPEFDVEQHFLHDIPAAVKARMYENPPRGPADTPFGQPCAFERWPDVPLRVLIGRDDRFFPADFQRRVAAERLAPDVHPEIRVDEIDGGHLVAKSRPTALADQLVGYAAAR